MANDGKITRIYEVEPRYLNIENKNNSTSVSQEMDLSSFTDKNYEYNCIKDVNYSKTPNCTYDLYLPDDQNCNKVVLYIHGGEFITGSKTDENEKRFWEYYKSKGYAIATIDYPLINDKNNVSLQKMSDEISKGVDSIKQQAALQGYNLENMIVDGYSAGGTLAIIYATNNQDKSSIPIKCVVNLAGPTSMDPATFDSSKTNNNDSKTILTMASKLTGKKLDSMTTYTKYTDEISPVHLIEKSNIPIISVYPTENDVFNPESAVKDFASASTKSNAENKCYVLQGVDHSLEGQENKLKEVFDQSITIAER